MQRDRHTWDKSYERRAVLLLTIGFGLVGLDRWIVAPLFPEMIRDLQLNYQDLGNIVGVLGLTWGVAALFFGGLSDRIGRRRVLIPSLVGFSLLCGLSGLAGGLASLLLIRGVMGVTEGAYCPTSLSAANDASRPWRRGFNLGLLQSAFPLFGLALGPILATQLLRVMSWRGVFLIVAVPGLVLAVLLARTIRDPEVPAPAAPGQRPRLYDILASRNVLLGMLALFCAMAAVFTISAMLPNYLIDYRHLSTSEMGYVTSAIGFGGFAGQISLSTVSDRLGRRMTAWVGFVLAAAFLFAFAHSGGGTMTLFALLFLSCFFCFGLLGLIAGPVAAEAAPVGLVSSTAGLIIGAGEIFGGGVAPVVAGSIAQRFGIEHTLTMATVGLAVGAVIGLFFSETAPRRMS